IHGFTPHPRGGHLDIYGKDAEGILDLVDKRASLSAKLHPDYPYMEAEVIWSVREEMAIKLDDFLSRRIRILILDTRAAMEMAPRVAELMAAELKKDQSWISRELTDFNNLANKYLIN